MWMLTSFRFGGWGSNDIPLLRNKRVARHDACIKHAAEHNGAQVLMCSEHMSDMMLLI